MSIVYTVIGRGSVILCKLAVCSGNFADVTDQILPKVSMEDHKLTYSHGDYLFHYIVQDRIVYMCITENDFERSKAFAFLNEICRRFRNSYGNRVHTALPYAMNSDFCMVLASEMNQMNNPSSTSPSVKYSGSQLQSPSTPGAYGATSSKTQKVAAEVEDLKNIMIKNIDSLSARGERLELLIDRTDNLSEGAISFRGQSRRLKSALCWKNIKITVALILLALIVLFIIITSACGGFTYHKCRSKY